ncbi:MAG: DNA-binding protein [Methylococcaceae bacterium]|jgi:excisionase family DNA binding protein|nr:MAG: DNA-binding protein [Methylococcaceae bacterium]
MTEKLISTSEAAAILGISASRVRQLIIEGRLESIKIGRDQLLEPDKVREFATRPRVRTGRPKTDMS